MKKILALILALALSLTLAACGGSKDPVSSGSPSSDTPSASQPADNGQTYELKMAMTSTSMAFASDFADLVSSATNGRVTVSIVDSQSLGGATDCLDMVREGTLDLLMLPAAQTAGEFPVSDIVQVPFLVPDSQCGQDVMYALLEGGYMDEYYDSTVPLFFACTDSQMLGFKGDMVASSLSDFKGMKIRAVSGITTNLVQDIMGATVVTMGMNDVYLSLNTGVIDAAFSSPVQMVSNSLYDVMDSVMNYPIYVGVLYCVANEKLWNSLPAELQGQIFSAGETKRDQIRAYYAAKESECLQTLRDNGLNVYEPNQSMIDDMIAKGQDLFAIFEEKLNKVGIDGAGVMETARKVIDGYAR